MKLFLAITNIVFTIVSILVCLVAMCYSVFGRAKKSWEDKRK